MRRGVVLFAAMALTLVACSGSDSGGSPGTTDTTAVPETTTTTEVPLEAGTQVSVYNPTVGDCIDRRQLVDATSKRTNTITLMLDCALPHSYEVFAVESYPAPTPTTTTTAAPTTTTSAAGRSGPTSSTSSTSTTTTPITLPNGGTIAPNGYPGEEAVRRHAKLQCAKAFQPYVGAPYETSQIEMGYLLPTGDNWTSNRTIVCWLRTTDDEGKLVGSKRGSGE